MREARSRPVTTGDTITRRGSRIGEVGLTRIVANGVIVTPRHPPQYE